MSAAVAPRRQSRRPRRRPLASDPSWYRDAVIYELRVSSFHDSDDDGIGDFRGLAQKLDYLEDLGVTALWLLPFCPSPQRDDGYDIADYTNVHSDFGTLEDFKAFLAEAHNRGMRVITELVINHTSDQHPWFQRARRAPSGSRHRDFYVWSDTAERYAEARVIFQDFEPSNWSWDPVARAYYWHRFYTHQPDLNFESSDVRQAVLRFLDFWLKLGVDGLRLDAIPYLFERDGTNCENLPATHDFLRDLRKHVDERFQDRMLLAEANQWPEDAVAYFGQGDECHMSFHFPVMPRLFMALQMEDRFPIIDILDQTPEIPEDCQWALFLRNHDELTLEMVTDEERDYMYRVYAHDAKARINLGIRRRLAPLLGNDRRRIELMNALLFSLPGTPVLYYGDEIGMGDNFYLGDRNGVRTPMQWSSDRNAGFSRANPQKLYLPVIVDPEYHYEAVNVEAQHENAHSLLSWTKRMIALRKRYRAFGRGSIEFLHPSNRKVLAFERRLADERILVVVNLSRFVEYVELDLSERRGLVPVELFSGHPLPPIGDHPYLLTLGPHSFYWMRLESARDESDADASSPAGLARISVQGSWESLLGKDRELLEAALPEILRQRRWFGGKGRRINRARLTDALLVRHDRGPSYLALIEVAQTGSDGVLYAVPVAFASDLRAEALRKDRPRACFADVEVEAREGIVHGVLFDALEEPAFCQALLSAIQRRRRLQTSKGELVASTTRTLATLRGSDDTPLEPHLLDAEQSNSSVVFGNRLALKLFRRPTEGINPDLELGRFLTERTRFAHSPPVAGAIEYRVGRSESRTLAILQGWVTNEGDAWGYTVDQVEQFYEDVVTRRAAPDLPGLDDARPFGLSAEQIPTPAAEAIGGYLETARMLGERTAELHLALASDREDPSFAPEPFSTLYQRSRYQAMRNLTARSFDLLRARRARLPEWLHDEADRLLSLERDLLEAFRAIVGSRFGGMRIRCHGDYHLGQVLRTGNDLVVIDFEGEPARSIGERRLKRSPLVDVAGMLRSFDYAAQQPLLVVGDALIREEDLPILEPWARLWPYWVSSAFLRAYLPRISQAGLVPEDDDELDRLLRTLLLDKAVYELGYELDNRPDWTGVPIRGILQLLPSGQEL